MGNTSEPLGVICAIESCAYNINSICCKNRVIINKEFKCESYEYDGKIASQHGNQKKE